MSRRVIITFEVPDNQVESVYETIDDALDAGIVQDAIQDWNGSSYDFKSSTVQIETLSTEDDVIATLATIASER